MLNFPNRPMIVQQADYPVKKRESIATIEAHRQWRKARRSGRIVDIYEAMLHVEELGLQAKLLRQRLP